MIQQNQQRVRKLSVLHTSLMSFLDGIASPSSYPCHWVGQWVSGWLLVLERAIASRDCELVLFTMRTTVFVGEGFPKWLMWIHLLREVRHLTTVFPSVRHHYTIITQSQNNHNGSLRCNYTNLSWEADKHVLAQLDPGGSLALSRTYNLIPLGPQRTFFNQQYFWTLVHHKEMRSQKKKNYNAM